MRSFTMMILFALCPVTASAICIVEPLDHQLRDSKVVFLATLTDAKLLDSSSRLEHGKSYTIIYSFKVRDRIKGNSATVQRLLSSAIYNDPTAKTYVEAAEQIELVPGNTVLVMANGESDVQIGFCTISRKWERGTKALESFRSRQAL